MSHKDAPPETESQKACREWWEKARPTVKRAWGRAQDGSFLAEETRLIHQSWEAASQQANAEVERLQAEIDALRTRLEDTVRDSTNKIEALHKEIRRLLDSREREGDRLDWLLARLPEDVIRDLVGEMSCTSDVSEWRDRIDKAARFEPLN